jgi:hypothetical protein
MAHVSVISWKFFSLYDLKEHFAIQYVTKFRISPKFRNVRNALSLMTKEISYREISFQTFYMSNYSIIHYTNLILSIKIDTTFVMWYFGDILHFFVTILRKVDEISYPSSHPQIIKKLPYPSDNIFSLIASFNHSFYLTN